MVDVDDFTAAPSGFSRFAIFVSQILRCPRGSRLGPCPPSISWCLAPTDAERISVALLPRHRVGSVFVVGHQALLRFSTRVPSESREYDSHDETQYEAWKGQDLTTPVPERHTAPNLLHWNEAAPVCPSATLSW